ncbi:MAG TPA: sigma-70 family RNA polymerase sigma factor [Steroidobacteraceae bacterium]|nr:sigma-70 family RNA polymerase sigma factor [Steroidobacteraceae bacterium]
MQELWRAFRLSRDQVVRERLVERYMPFARTIAAKLYGLRPDNAVPFSDYHQYARVGLLEAIDRYDETRNVPFESYSTHRIRGAILNGIGHEHEVAAQREFWRSHVPDRLGSVLNQLGTKPERTSLEEIAEITVGIALGLVLDQGDDDPVDQSTEGNPYAATELAHFTRLLRSLVELLPIREREIIAGHYFEHHEFQSIAERYGITKGRVSQLHAQALRRLRDLLEGKPKVNRKL